MIDEPIKSVRDLANLDAEYNEGFLSAAVFSALEKGDVFVVGSRRFTVTQKSKPAKHVFEHTQKAQPEKGIYTSHEGKVMEFTKALLKIESEKGDKITGSLYHFENGASKWSGHNQTRKKDAWGQLSRDIEGDIMRDLVNENNPFHDKSDSFKMVEKYIFSVNQTPSVHPLETELLKLKMENK